MSRDKLSSNLSDGRDRSLSCTDGRSGRYDQGSFVRSGLARDQRSEGGMAEGWMPRS